jgi:predicted nuclease of predicted toxin-antitoxin system
MAEFFNNLGWDCETVYDEELTGSPDDHIADACSREGRILVTFDKDFGDHRFSDRLDRTGLILLRLADQGLTEVKSAIIEAIPHLESALKTSRFVVVENHRIRVGRWVRPTSREMEEHP